MSDLRGLDYLHSDENARPKYAAAHQYLRENADLIADVVLERSGILAIGKPVWADLALAERSVVYERHQSIDLEHALADQIYFFVRDISHQHQHHSSDADTIITTQMCVDGQDMAWCRNILFSLYFHIIQIKRRTDPSEHVRVLGILAYVKAFKNVVQHRAEARGVNFKMPFFDDDSTKESITAAKNFIELQVTKRRQRLDELRTIIFAVAALIVSSFSFMNGFADVQVQPPAIMRAIADVMKANSYLALVPLGIVVVWLVATLILRPKYGVKRDVIRIALTNRWIAGTAIGALGALVLVAGVLYGIRSASLLLRL